MDADTGKAAGTSGDVRQADAARHDGGGGGKSLADGRRRPQDPAAQNCQLIGKKTRVRRRRKLLLSEGGTTADRQANGATPNGSGGVMTSGQRLLAAQSGASTLDPRRSDD